MEENAPSGPSVEQTLPPKQISTLYKTCQLPPASKCIRVLDILPVAVSASNDADIIESKLRIVDLESSPKFTALSYVWGTYAREPNFIKCNDNQFKLTSNCYSALWHLRKKLGTFTIWIDAICINQDDLQEKSQQIPLMGDIYSKAEAVYVWLGDGTPQTERAMTYMANDHFQRYYSTTEVGNLRFRPYAALRFIMWARWSRNIPPVPYGARDNRKINRWIRSRLGRPHTMFADLNELFTKPWINRLWTYQEILLASRPIVVCGDRHVPWSIFERNFVFLDNTTLFSPHGMLKPWINVSLSRERLQTSSLAFSSFEPSDLEKYSIFVRAIGQAYRKVALGSYIILILVITPATVVPLSVLVPGEMLFSLLLIFLGLIWFFLFDFRGSLKTGTVETPFATEQFTAGLYSRTATERKDMAFGMWAVLERGGTANLPPPDYSHSKGDIYRALTTSLWEATQSLDGLYLAALQGVAKQPSWVPDWSAHKEHIWGYNLDELQNTDNSGCLIDKRPRHFSKPKLPMKTTAYFEVDETQAVLTVRAHHVSDIKMCFHFQRTQEHFVESERKLHLENIRQILKWTSSRLQKRATWPQWFGTAPSAPIDVDLKPQYRRPRQSSGTWMRFCCRNRNRDPSQVLAVLLGNPRLLTIHIDHCNMLASTQRVNFCAENPDFLVKPILGICSGIVQAGDQIVRVEGLPQLLIVRGQDGAKTSVKIVSPVEIQLYDSKPIELVGGKESEPFVDYYIY